MGKNILLVDDNTGSAVANKSYLESIGMCVELVRHSEHAFLQATNKLWDAVVLELIPPITNGIEFCRKLRENNIQVAILIVSHISSEHHQIELLNAGADDYIIRPHDVKHLAARINKTLRRSKCDFQKVSASPILLQFRDLTVDVENRIVRKSIISIDLTPIEFDLLVHFLENPNRIFSRAQLLSTVWRHSHDGHEHTVSAHINRLRSKIELDSSEPTHILTVWGKGYRLGHESGS